MPPLTQKLKLAVKRPVRTSEPVWRGPQEDGVTFSLLSRFLTCRERFRLMVVEGLVPNPVFNHRIEYGQMWHLCEEMLAQGCAWEGMLDTYCLDLKRKYPMQQKEVMHWKEVCRVQFPIYEEYWAKHPDVKERKPLLQEYKFQVPITLPSGRKVKLRGKWDSIDLITDYQGLHATRGIWVQENKTKGDVREQQLRRQLTFDLQTMIYVVAAEEVMNCSYEIPKELLRLRASGLMGVRYNVVRRPLSGGKGNIKRRQAKTVGKGSKRRQVPGETREEYYERVQSYITADPAHYFMRFRVDVTQADIQVFLHQCLYPILEQLCWWWEEVTGQGHGKYPFPPIHWRHPFGVRNILDEGGSSDLDDYLAEGNEVGLTRTDNLFPEL